MTIIRILLLVLLFAAPGAADNRQDLFAALKTPGAVLMLRHAIAPGSGDPAHFKLEDCGTQRNLDASGRQQARDIGAMLRRNGIKQARIYSSQWCRCLETAHLMALGPVQSLPALNSFYQRPEDRDARVNALRNFLEVQPRDGGLLILVTHFVTIAAITGSGVASGEGVVLQLTEGDPRWVGRVAFEP